MFSTFPLVTFLLLHSSASHADEMKPVSEIPQVFSQNDLDVGEIQPASALNALEDTGENQEKQRNPGIYDLSDPAQVAEYQTILNASATVEKTGMLSTCYCGRINGGMNRILGGWPVENQGFYPWIVRLSSGCGGTVVSDRWIVTAAHCITMFSSPSQLSIKFREHQLFASDAGEFQVVAKTFLYYGTLYNPSSLDYDIALVELSAPVTITGPSYIRPACLIAQGFDVNAFIGVPIGWGVHMNGVGSQSPVLRETRVSILNRAKCLLSGGDPSSTHICGYTKANGICYGDSGGPLTVYSSGKHYLAGVTSGTRGNREQNICSTDWPQYYTQATLFTDVIVQYAWDNANYCSY